MTRFCAHGVSMDEICGRCAESYGNNRVLGAEDAEVYRAETQRKLEAHHSALAAQWFQKGREAAINGKSAVDVVGNASACHDPALGMLAAWLDQVMKRH